ncbi:MAG: hypothetical protein Q8868_06215 [Bacteroidota bacterium]|nr:hypothetical protein [Bacteroidota bacterium]
MADKRTYTEKNIEMLIRSSLNKENQLSAQQKDDVLHLLLLKAAQQKKDLKPKTMALFGLSVIWIALSALLFSEIRNPLYVVDLIKAALIPSLVFIPVSSIILIIIKSKTYEKKMA